MSSQLTQEEQTNVRTALRHLRMRCGGWRPVGKALGFKHNTLTHLVGKKPVSVTVAFAIARLVGVAVEDVLTGKYPAFGACPHCGHVVEPSD